LDRWLGRIPGLASGPPWRRGLALAGYAFAAAVAYEAIAGTSPTPTPTPEPPAVEDSQDIPQPAPAPAPSSIFGKWRGQTQTSLGVMTIEVVFVGNGNYSALSTTQYPGGTPLLVTGKFTVDDAQHVITVSNVRTDPRFPIDNVLIQYTWLDSNTLRLQDLGCLNYAPDQCGPIRYTRVY